MNKDIGKYGNKFTSSNQPPNRGRKPKLYTIAKKGYDIGMDDFREVAGYLMQCTKEKRQEIASDPSTPIWVANICRALYKDAGYGSIKTLMELVEVIFGKAARLDITTNGESIRSEPVVIEVIDKREQVVTNDEDPDDEGLQGG